MQVFQQAFSIFAAAKNFNYTKSAYPHFQSMMKLESASNKNVGDRFKTGKRLLSKALQSVG